jgi:endonuclease YncB( thermonuclease family)
MKYWSVLTIRPSFSLPILNNKTLNAGLGASVLLVAFLMFLHPLGSQAADFTGCLVGVLDGETIEALHTQYSERIRLSGIDCPEKGQAFGKRVEASAPNRVPCGWWSTATVSRSKPSPTSSLYPV